jgi:hypothetical protein
MEQQLYGATTDDNKQDYLANNSGVYMYMLRGTLPRQSHFDETVCCQGRQNRYCIADKAKQQPSRTQSRSKKVEHQIRPRKDDAAIIISDDLLMANLKAARLSQSRNHGLTSSNPSAFSQQLFPTIASLGFRDFLQQFVSSDCSWRQLLGGQKSPALTWPCTTFASNKKRDI